jgi:5-methyltetrahydropteroyltriglutamate--homocysteine methyltransferase
MSKAVCKYVDLKTSVVGSFPKPTYLRIPDWFAMKEGKKGLLGTNPFAYAEFLDSMKAADKSQLEDDIMKATHEVIQAQCMCGVDIPTDGEVRRENYIHYLCRCIDGIDFENLTEASVRNGAFTASIPTIRSKVFWKGGFSCATEWKKAQAAYPDAPVKYTLPGPMTIIGSTANAFYPDNESLATDLAAVINIHVRELSRAGCKNIQIDEPLMARKPEEALAYGVRLLDACFEGCAPDVEKFVHCCCGYPGQVDQTEYLKADRDAYFKIAPALNKSVIDVISIEDAWRNNDLSLLALFTKKKVMLGTMNSASSRVETPEEMRARLTEALKYIHPERLYVGPDCGLGMLGSQYRSLLTQKLTNMCAAAKGVPYSGSPFAKKEAKAMKKSKPVMKAMKAMKAAKPTKVMKAMKKSKRK